MNLCENVTIIIVTYESQAIAQNLASSLANYHNIVIVDNASKDLTMKTLTKLLSNATFIKNDKNLGFGSANNIGVALAKTPYVLLINPDCEITEENLQQLLKTAHYFPNAGLVAPQAHYKNGNIQISYRQAYFEKSTSKNYSIPDACCSAKWLNGCCLLVNIEAYRKVGGFDSRFFLFYEEDDLCLKMLDAGYDCILDPDAKIIHHGGASSQTSLKLVLFKHFHYARSRHLITQKYQNSLSAFIYRLKIAFAAPPSFLFYALLKKNKNLALQWLGWGSFAWKFWR